MCVYIFILLCAHTHNFTHRKIDFFVMNNLRSLIFQQWTEAKKVSTGKNMRDW